MTAQLDLFLANDEESLNRREIASLRDYQTRSNRAAHAKMKDIGNEIVKLADELDRVRNLMVRERK